MQTYGIAVRGRSVASNSADSTLVRTSVGIDRVHILFDSSEWLDFPIQISFGNGDALVSQSLVLADLESSEWAAEAECTVPWEVIRELGRIRVTLQGTDGSGNHIITAAGAPLSVVEAGDVAAGSVPDPAPTVDAWNQAYAKAMGAATEAQSAAARVETLLASTTAETLEGLLRELDEFEPITDAEIHAITGQNGSGVYADADTEDY